MGKQIDLGRIVQRLRELGHDDCTEDNVVELLKEMNLEVFLGGSAAAPSAPPASAKPPTGPSSTREAPRPTTNTSTTKPSPAISIPTAEPEASAPSAPNSATVPPHLAPLWTLGSEALGASQYSLHSSHHSTASHSSSRTQNSRYLDSSRELGDSDLEESPARTRPGAAAREAEESLTDHDAHAVGSGAASAVLGVGRVDPVDTSAASHGSRGAVSVYSAGGLGDGSSFMSASAFAEEEGEEEVHAWLRPGSTSSRDASRHHHQGDYSRDAEASDAGDADPHPWGLGLGLEASPASAALHHHHHRRAHQSPPPRRSLFAHTAAATPATPATPVTPATPAHAGHRRASGAAPAASTPLSAGRLQSSGIKGRARRVPAPIHEAGGGGALEGELDAYAAADVAPVSAPLDSPLCALGRARKGAAAADGHSGAHTTPSKRPVTAPMHRIAVMSPPGGPAGPKVDRVARYQQLASAWERDSFLTRGNAVSGTGRRPTENFFLKHRAQHALEAYKLKRKTQQCQSQSGTGPAAHGAAIGSGVAARR